MAMGLSPMTWGHPSIAFCLYPIMSGMLDWSSLDPSSVYTCSFCPLIGGLANLGWYDKSQGVWPSSFHLSCVCRVTAEAEGQWRLHRQAKWRRGMWGRRS
jgi:hypothetical protein